MHDLLRLRDLALSAAARAGEIHLEWFRRADLSVELKADESPVTVADRDSEQAIREVLRAGAPEFGIMGEEFGSEGDARDRFIIDPIDGTKNFVRGFPVFACLIGLEIDGEIRLGVVHAPAMWRETWWAAEGHGCWRGASADTPADEFERVRVSKVATLDEAFVSTGSLAAVIETDTWAALHELASRSARQRTLGDWWGHTSVASGQVDIHWDPVVEPYDVAPLKILVEEAGGRFTDLAGSPTIYSGHALTTNGALHEVARRILVDSRAGGR